MPKTLHSLPTMMRPIELLVAVLAGTAALAPAARAQGCAMCYSAASAAGKAAARALDSGILVLLIPTLILFVGVLVFAIRRASSAG